MRVWHLARKIGERRDGAPVYQFWSEPGGASAYASQAKDFPCARAAYAYAALYPEVIDPEVWIAIPGRPKLEEQVA